jgi:pimeloyl-ACP methyl ester carboxylesterase
MDLGLPTEEQIWNIPFNGSTTATLLQTLAQILPKLVADANNNLDEAVERANDACLSLLSKLEMNPDGTSKNNVTPYPSGAKNARWDVMLERGEERFNNQRPITNSFLDYVDADHVYIFASDWRMGLLENAAALVDFVEEVKADSGHSKVSLYGISYGGALGAAYLHYYANPDDIDRVVLLSPALQGTSLTYDIMEKPNFTFDLASIADFSAVYAQTEIRLANPLSGITPTQLNELAVRIIRRYIQPLVMHFGSFWDIVPNEYYAELKNKYLDPVLNGRIIEQSDQIHNDFMPNIGATFRDLQQKGVKIAIISGSGLKMAGGGMVNSDYVIDVRSTTGAVAAPIGETLSEYAQDVCTDPTHRHISPNGQIDASDAFLPEHTWFFEGQYHGQAAWDSYCRSLYCKWLFTNDIQDIYSSPQYPQFRDSCNPMDAIEARFSSSVSGYLTGDDETLTLTNHASHAVNLLHVRAENLNFKVNFFTPIVIQPGKTIQLRYESILPAETTKFKLHVTYMIENAVVFEQEIDRVFTFTTMPQNTDIPAFLRYPSGGQAAQRFEIRPARFALLLVALFGSLAIGSTCVTLIYRRKLNDQAPD